MTHEREKVQGGGEYAIPEPPDPGVDVLWGRGGTCWEREGWVWYDRERKLIPHTWESLLATYGPLSTAPPVPPR